MPLLALALFCHHVHSAANRCAIYDKKAIHIMRKIPTDLRLRSFHLSYPNNLQKLLLLTLACAISGYYLVPATADSAWVGLDPDEMVEVWQVQSGDIKRYTDFEKV